MSELRFLFVPVSGPGGAGEYFRSLAVAKAIERRWPGSTIHFIVSRDAPYSKDAIFPVELIDRSPTYETAVVNEIIARLRPHVVLFDSAGRVAQFRAAKRAGARVVFISSRPSIRRKGFKLRRMRWLDQHWITHPRFLGGELSPPEKFKCRLMPHVEVLPLDVLHEPIDGPGTKAIQHQLGLQPGGYVVVCPGGGGLVSGKSDPAEVYFEAAGTIARDTRLPVVAVLGQRFAPPDRLPQGVHVFASLHNAVLMGLVRDARCCALNGGSLLLQSIAQRTPSVAAPIADDQPARIERCAGLGLARPAAFEAGELSAATSDLALDERELEQLRTRLVDFDLRNGLDLAVEALDRLLPTEYRAPVPRSDSVRRLRLMHVILSSGFAGSERAVAEFCSAAAEQHEVAVVLRRDHRSPGGASIRDHLGPEVKVVELPSYIGTRRALEEAITDWRPDVVHTHLRRGTRYVARIAPADAVHFCTLHLSLNGPHFLYSDGLVCISQWQQGTLPGDYEGKVFLIPNSLVPQPRLDQARRRELRRQLGAGDDDFLIGGVGRLTPSKGFDILVKAFRQAELPGAKLTIVGEGRARRRLERLAGGQVTFTGHRHDAKDCFQAFDLFVSPSRYEPFGRVIVEALDGGVPVIATDALGPRDIALRYPVELVPKEDPAAMAAALRLVFERPRTRLSVDLSEFHIDRVVRRTLEAYLELLNAPSPDRQAAVQS